VKSELVGEILDGKVYAAKLTPEAAKELLFVSTYDTQDPLSPAADKHGYQRPPMKHRFPEIGKYYRTANHAELVTPITVSVRLTEEEDIDFFLKLLAEGNVNGILKKFGKVASIVDGQHRAGGLVWAWEQDAEFRPVIPVFLYFGLTFVDETDLFNTINVTQRKLPKALIETNKGDITDAQVVSYAQRIRRITFSLCRDADSVWGPKDGKEQINMTGMRDPDKPVTYEGLRRSTSNMFPETLLQRLDNLDEGLALKLAKRYWRAVSQACPEAWNNNPATRPVVNEDGEETTVKIQYRIKDLVGVASLAKLGMSIIGSHIEAPSGNKIEELTAKLDAVNWEKAEDNPWMKSQAGFAGQKDLYQVLYAWVYSDISPEDVKEAQVAAKSVKKAA
jgi:DGQHR domain-containing protein